MKSLILRTATRFLMPLLLLFAVFLLLRGHNEPGGGFVGGLVVSAAFVLYAIAYGVDAGRRALLVDPSTLLSVGLLVALVSAIPGVLLGFIAGPSQGIYVLLVYVVVQQLEGLVGDGQADDGVDEIGVYVQATEHAEQQRDAVADREQGDVEADVAQTVEEEHDTREE